MKAGRYLLLLVTTLISLPSWAQPLNIKVLDFTNANQQDLIRVNSALELLKIVVNQDSFRQEILNMTYNIGSRTYTGFTQTKQTREQVMESILRAEEIFEGGSPATMDLYMDMYQENSDTVGYTTPSDPYFHMNRWIQADYSPAKTSGNIFHEWLHKLGHGHTKRNNKYRPHSVPYKLGKMVATMSAELAANGDPVMESLMLAEYQEILDMPCSHQ